jgi:hypothetical protein
LKIPDTCPKCKLFLKTDFPTRIAQSGLMVKLCNERLDHSFWASSKESLNGFHDIYTIIISFKEADFRKTKKAIWDFEKKTLTITYPYTFSSAQEIEFFIPNLNDYASILNKLNMCITFS